MRWFGAAVAALTALAWAGRARGEGAADAARAEAFLSHPAFVQWWEAAREKADLDGDGTVNQRERAQLAERLRERRQALRRAILERFDADGNGKIAGPEMAALRTCLEAHPLLRERLRWRMDRLEDIRDRREDVRDRREDRLDRRIRGGPLDRLEDVRDRREDVRDRREDLRDRSVEPPGPWWRRALLGPAARDRAEDVLDRREDVRDAREDIRDRREDLLDGRLQGGPRDELEDILDRLEDIRDAREDARDRLEDRMDSRRSPARSRGPERHGN